MKARVVVEVEASRYDEIASASALDLTLDEVEIRQEDGLLSCTRRVRLVEGIAQAAREQSGVDVTRPAMRLHVQTDQED